MNRNITIIALCILLAVSCFLLGLKWKQGDSDDLLIRMQQEAIKAEQDSILHRNNQQDQFYNQQLDSLYSIIETITHQKSLSQQQINTLKERLKQQEEARKTYLKSITQ